MTREKVKKLWHVRLFVTFEMQHQMSPFGLSGLTVSVLTSISLNPARDVEKAEFQCAMTSGGSFKKPLFETY